MNEFILENPKAIVTAFTGIILFIIQKFVFDFPPEVESYINIILPSVFLMLLGRFTRITKSEAIVLEKISDNKNQL